MRKFVTTSAAVLTSLSLFAATSLAVAPSAFADSGISLNAKADGTSAERGKNFSVEITVSTGDSKINIVQACMTYDSTKLDYVSVNYDDSPLHTDVPKAPTTDCKTGEIQLARYDASSQPSGTFTLGKVTFKPKVSTGDTTVGFDFSKSLVFGNENPGINLLKETDNAKITLKGSTATPAKASSKTKYFLAAAMLVVFITVYVLVRKRRGAHTPTKTSTDE